MHILLFMFMGEIAVAQDFLPRLGVAPLVTHDDIFKIKYRELYANTGIIREKVWGAMVKTGKYEVLDLRDVDAILEGQEVPVRLIPDRENIKRLRELRIDYMITGSMAFEFKLYHAYYKYSITIKLLNISTGNYEYQDHVYLNELNPGIVQDFVNNFAAAVTGGNGQAVTKEREYIRGDFGPAGGLVCYDKGEYTDGWRYIELAPPETEFKSSWGAYGTAIGGTGEAIGSGRGNTRILVDKFKAGGLAGTAAQLCDDLECNGYDDWFLPSRQELFYALLVIGLPPDAAPSASRYWSSSQSSARYAWVARSVCEGLYAKDGINKVRAIRVF
jgi:hypothetical protein